MLKGLLYGEPLFRVHLKHSLYELQCLLAEFTEVFSFESFWLVDFWKFRSNVAWVFLEILVLFRRERPQRLLDQKELIYFVFSWKQGLPIDQLSHNARCS